MSDLLSAASLLMTVIAILYGLWQNDLGAGLKINPGPPADNRPSERRVFALITTKAFPLAAMAWATSLVFMPQAISLSISSVRHWSQFNGGGYRYNAVSTAFCLVVAFSLILSGYTSAMLAGLIRLWLKLRRRQ
jgi:hypothetical protein